MEKRRNCSFKRYIENIVEMRRNCSFKRYIENIVEKRRNCSLGEISPLFSNILLPIVRFHVKKGPVFHFEISGYSEISEVEITRVDRIFLRIYEPLYEKTYIQSCALNEDSSRSQQCDQCLRCLHEETYSLLGYPKCVQWRLWSDCAI